MLEWQRKCGQDGPIRYCIAFMAGIILALSAAPLPAGQDAVKPPLPVLPIPSQAQLKWQENELALFAHFGVNTFTNREWGTGEEDPDVFQPTDLNTDQWARVAKECGFRTIILTAKHHDGFCLWPSKYTDHSVESSSWRGGKGDVVAELQESCQELGINMGLYLSPWDRHEPSYGEQVGYNEYYVAQLRELASDYGPLFELWFDGAKGKDAKDMSYEQDTYWAVARQLQPQAVLAIVGPDIRWVGNERGKAGETCWSLVNPSKGGREYLNTGDPEGTKWEPAECDVSLRRGWFWHKKEDPKSLAELMDIYFKSVGHNSKLLLNVPPNKEGQFSDEDVERLREFRDAVDAIFDRNLATGAKTVAGSVRGESSSYGPDRVLDGDMETYWAPAAGKSKGTIELDFGEPIGFNVVCLQEPIHMGQRVKKYHVDVRTNGGWETVAEKETIGYKWLIPLEDVTASGLRLVIEETRKDSSPLISEIGVFHDPRNY